MVDFKADALITFELESRMIEILLEDVTKPCTMRGAYFLSFDSKDPITFHVIYYN